MFKTILIAFIIIFSKQAQGEVISKDTFSIVKVKYWSKSDKLSWEDFQGKPPQSILTTYSTEGLANTAAEIVIVLDVINKEVTFKVYPLFNKTKSWHKSNSGQLLTHEQLHFDIAELVARKIRKTLDSLKSENITDTVFYLNKIKELMAVQNNTNSLYDSETLHGAVDSMQIEWNKKIAKELCELQEYEVDYSKYIEE